MNKKNSKCCEIKKIHDDYTFSIFNYYKEPIVFSEGKGVYLKDVEGREYLDFFGGIVTVSIEHCNSEVTKAIQEQASKLVHVSTLYPTPPLVELAKNISDIAPGKLQKCFFTTSGTDANETAIMLAQCYNGSSELIALRHGYSGRSMLGQALTAQSVWRVLQTSVSGIKHAHNPYCYRCDFGLKYPECELRCAKDIENIIQTTTTGQIMGFIAEPIQGVGGVIVPPKEYFKVALEIIRKYGGVFICDEVQTGFGRTGKKHFGIEHFEVEPEIMTMAKGVANGLPLGVTITIPELSNSIPRLTIATFGGNPVSCAAANAVINVIKENNLINHVARVGEFIKHKLFELKEKYSIIGDIRGMGLLQAIEFVVDEKKKNRTPNPEATVKIFEKARQLGLLIGKCGLYGNIIRITPPMMINKAQIEDGLNILDKAIELSL